MPSKHLSRRHLLGAVVGSSAALAGCSSILGEEPVDPKLAGIHVDGSDETTLAVDLLVMVDGKIEFSRTMVLENANDRRFDFSDDGMPDVRTNCVVAVRTREHSDWIQWDPKEQDSLREPCYALKANINKIPDISTMKYRPEIPFDCDAKATSD